MGLAVRDSLVSLVPPHSLSAVEPDLTNVFGHHFARPELLREALTHRSAVRERRRPGPPAGSNERLEFIGDRVLGLLIAEWVADRFPREQEGDLGRRLAYLVSQPVLAEVAEQIGLGPMLSVSAGEARAGVKKRATVLADALEAAIGALYIDGGIASARAFVRRAWDAAMQSQKVPPVDPKTGLQEWAQGRGLPLPIYQVLSRAGPPHKPTFEVAVSVGGATGTGIAGTKRAAERLAAENLLQHFNK